MKKLLSVRLNEEPIGILEQTINGNLQFTYLQSASRAISLSMPLNEKPYENAICESYFGGLLPENIHAKKIIGKQYGISPNNTFSLLQAIGHDCAGAISLQAMEAPILTTRKIPLQGSIVSDSTLYQHIKNLPQKPLFLDVKELRLSLAGAQDKAAVCMIDGEIAFPINDCPTTHILKPEISGFNGIVENEYLCMQTAAAIGMEVPEVEIKQIKNIKYLLISRYDRKIKNNFIERVHQEDFCQALGILSKNKYQNEGGPGFKQCFNLLDNTTQPAIARKKLITAVIFNFLIGNMDAHGKNFSLLHLNKNKISLTPFYDLVCTRFYPEITTKMAMKIGNKYEADYVLSRHFQQLCEEINYSYPMFKRLLSTQANKIVTALNNHKEHYIEITKNPKVINDLTKVITQNIDKALSNFES